ncbi:Mitochondrial enolase superfamily member 1 [Bifiguratus adelaidae]|uniref:L-fuconate dehydratase n=1 Tax=Bifiguratus adelaidae TaxID=1938954 RepID=A0A261Y572_9FUNG|nr:Mitochondrial enolase superfamily member 1 [Bifiguratus adelaidae]
MVTITGYEVHDIRFPTSKQKDGSDAMNLDPDYSAAYVILQTDAGLEGHGLTFTCGRGNEVVCCAIEALAPKLVNKTLDELTADMFATSRVLTGDSQLRWIGPEKGAIHLATGAVNNAIWDLWAKAEKKPMWKLVADMSPEQLVECIDFRYITDVLTKEQAIDMLRKNEPAKKQRIEEMKDTGYPAYVTSIGWLGYSDEKVKQRCADAVAQGWTHFKQKVGGNLEQDIHRARLIREVVGYDAKLMMDANQVWDVPQAIEWMEKLLEFKPLWIEEPTSPDDILGHAAIRKALYPRTGVATGEMIQNRILFKQLFQAKAIDFCQVDACRVGGMSEVLAILLMAAKFGVPVCPHSGGVGLCEYTQHISFIDYIVVSASLENNLLEYADHLHEHFEDPCVVRKGRYMLPSAPGYSITMKRESIEAFEFPKGKMHQQNVH